MTAVTYEPQGWHLRIEGHAGAAPAGEDLVCAAVSALGWTLIACVSDDPGFRSAVYLCENKAIMDVRCDPEDRKQDEAAAIYKTIMTGLRRLGEQYPDHVRIRG